MSSELWNQPRYWSPPSRYISAGQGSWLAGVSTAKWLEPESNQTSRMSDSLVNSAPPHLEHVVPGGNNSAAEREYQISAVCLANSATTGSRYLRSMSGSRHLPQ